MKDELPDSIAVLIVYLLIYLSILGYHEYKAHLITEYVGQQQSYIDVHADPIRPYALALVSEEWGREHWSSFDYIVTKESRWKATAQNPRSTAFGLCQFLNSTWEGEKTSDPYIQLDECKEYIKDRYGTPYKAYTFHKINNYY